MKNRQRGRLIKLEIAEKIEEENIARGRNSKGGSHEDFIDEQYEPEYSTIMELK